MELKRALRSLAAVFTLAATSVLYGQSTTSGLSGRVVDETADPIGGAAVEITHVPTNAVYRTTSDNAGRFSYGGLRVGGPYTILISQDGYQARFETNVILELGETYRLNVSMAQAGETIELDAFEVTAGPTTVFDLNTYGSGSVVDSTAIELTPSINEAVSDIVRLNPLVAIMDTERLEINAAGQHFRQNSIQVDGVNLNDQFGLEPSGLPSLNNPFSARTIEQYNVSVSPYDVRSSGFTGASINAVTKSGTNEFSGEIYYFFSDDSLRAANVFSGERPVYESDTYGISLGGPILKDRVFFFLNYEEAIIERAASSPGFIPDADEVERLRSYLMGLSTNAYPSGYDPGTWGEVSAASQEDEKLLAKIDWLISDNHRLTVRYSQTEAIEPQFGEYGDSGETSLTSHYFTNEFKNTAFAAQLNSRWSDMIETEFVIARDTFDKSPTYNDPNLFPEIIIDQFPGTRIDGTPITNGELYFGSEDSRQANDLATETNKAKGTVTAYLGDHTLVVGFDYEKPEFANLFLQDVYGNISYRTLDDLIDDLIIGGDLLDDDGNKILDDDGEPISNRSFMNRNTGVQGQQIAASSDYSTLGLFVQDTWAVNNQLQVLLGLRYDYFSTDQTPAYNEAFFNDFVSQDGRRNIDNSNTIDGNSTIGVRAGFRYDLTSPNSRRQLRGGVGLFQGRVPAVYMSNAFSNNGVTTAIIDYQDTDAFPGGVTLTDYLNNEFNPNDPIIYQSEPRLGQIDLIDEDFEMPSVWKANIAYDHQIGSSDWTATVELLQTWTEKGIYVEHLNLNQIGTAPDGRALYAGRPDRGNGFDEDFGNVYNLVNTDKGAASNVVIGISRPMINNWSFNASYTYGDSDDVSSVTSSTAFSNYANRAIFNANEDVVGRSNYEIRHRFLMRGAYKIDWSERTATTISGVYEVRSGRPYSHVYGNDFNNDSLFGNDLIYVPTGVDDPLVAFEGSAEEIEAFFNYLANEDLLEFAGGPVSRNAGRSPLTRRLDIRVSQSIELVNGTSLELFVSVQNFMNLLNDDWGQTSEVPFNFTAEVADGGIEDGKIVYDVSNPGDRPQVDPDRNYAISLGANFKF